MANTVLFSTLSKHLSLLDLPPYTCQWFLSGFKLPHPKICCETSECPFPPQAIQIHKQHRQDTFKDVYITSYTCYLWIVSKLVIFSFAIT